MSYTCVLYNCCCCFSFTKSCPTLCDNMDSSMPGFSVLQYLSEFAQIHGHLILCHSHLLLPSIFPTLKVYSNEMALPIRWPKYWGFTFSNSPFNVYSRLISFRILISMQSKGLSRILSSTTIRKHRFFSTQSSSGSKSHTQPWLLETIALTIWIFVSKAVSLSLFSDVFMLSRFVKAFLPRRKHLLILWLQSPSTAILEPKIIKSVTFFIVSVSIYLSDTVPNRMKRDRTGKVLRNPFSLFPWLLWR